MSARKRRNDHGGRNRDTTPAPVLEGIDASLLDIVDHVLTKGIVLTGDLVLGVADIDLVYLRLSAVLCAADRILGASTEAKRRRTRHGNDTAGSGPLSGPPVLASKLGAPRLGPTVAQVEPAPKRARARTKRA